MLCLGFVLGMFATCGAAAEPEATEEPAAAPGALTIMTDDGLAENSDSSAIRGGANMDDAILLPLNTKLYGTTNVGGQWYAFTTTSDPSAVYSMTTVNKTRGTHEVGVFVYDGSGEELKLHTNGDWGGPYTTVLEDLAPDTVYYLKIESGYYSPSNGLWNSYDEEIDYTLTIKAPEAPATPAPATVEPLIFETPFELNETRVMFVGDEATFIDEAAAREACAPVADVILAHPDHQVLLVGTTASNGSDEYCLDLSSRRAAAVKDLLVNSYGVPEDQLLSVGLGYKLDPFARANDLDANGKLIESEACKNRRVIVLDAEDPIAQEILASNG